MIVVSVKKLVSMAFTLVLKMVSAVEVVNHPFVPLALCVLNRAFSMDQTWIERFHQQFLTREAVH